MILHFYKYHGTGNDFIMLDARNNRFVTPGPETIATLCHRRFGIGADGLVTIHPHEKLNFTMKYYNSDGYEGSMCGNAGRCAVKFAKKLGITGTSARFEAVDGIHEGSISSDNTVILTLLPVSTVLYTGGHYELSTGSPHYVKFTNMLEDMDVRKEGSAIRYSRKYKKDGINVNFVSFYQDGIYVRTYERGVEDETLSCGTGIIASAICADIEKKSDKHSWIIYTRGGTLHVSFNRSGKKRFENITLQGPATFVFEGDVEI